MYGPSPDERIAMARRLLSRNRLSEALDVLNEAVRMDPRYADTFDCRADVFEKMGMYPHAQADRRKASDLRASATPAPPAPPAAAPAPPPEVKAPPPEAPAPPVIAAIPLAEPELEAAAEPEVPVAQPVAVPEEAFEEEGEPDAVADFLEEAGVEEAVIVPSPEPERSPVPVYRGPSRPSVSGAMLRAAGVVLVALGLFVAGGVGIYMALDAIGGDDDPSAATGETPTPPASGVEGGGAPTDDGGPQTVEEALRGDPYGFSSVQTAFEGAGFAVTVGDFSDTVSGFSESPVDVTISRDGLTMEMSVLMYDSEDAPNQDWVLGTPTTPRGEGIVPVGSTVWYNLNVVMIVLVSDETLRQDALDAFLDLA